MGVVELNDINHIFGLVFVFDDTKDLSLACNYENG